MIGIMAPLFQADLRVSDGYGFSPFLPPPARARPSLYFLPKTLWSLTNRSLLPDFCRDQSCFVVHFGAICNGRHR